PARPLSLRRARAAYRVVPRPRRALHRTRFAGHPRLASRHRTAQRPSAHEHLQECLWAYATVQHRAVDRFLPSYPLTLTLSSTGRGEGEGARGYSILRTPRSGWPAVRSASGTQGKGDPLAFP